MGGKTDRPSPQYFLKMLLSCFSRCNFLSCEVIALWVDCSAGRLLHMLLLRCVLLFEEQHIMLNVEILVLQIPLPCYHRPSRGGIVCALVDFLNDLPK